VTLFEKIKKVFAKNSPPVDLSKAKRVLAIDDDPTLRKMIQSTLQKKGYAVLTTDTGENGLKLAQDEKPHVILLDVILPGMKGNEVCRRLKNDPLTKDIPIIFLTSQDSPQEVIEHYELGADIHLTKPIDPKELLSQVQISLGEK